MSGYRKRTANMRSVSNTYQGSDLCRRGGSRVLGSPRRSSAHQGSSLEVPDLAPAVLSTRDHSGHSCELPKFIYLKTSHWARVAVYYSFHMSLPRSVSQINRAYFAAPIPAFLAESTESIVGEIAASHTQDITYLQTNAWRSQIAHLRRELDGLQEGHIYFEFVIPRMGKRADAILLISGIVFVIEFKIGAEAFAQHDLRQVEGYALDLKHFHAGSHDLTIAPILVATAAPTSRVHLTQDDGVFHPICSNGHNLREIIGVVKVHTPGIPIEPDAWATSAYRPTPTIIEASQALYANHSVYDIARSDAGATNLAVTAGTLRRIINDSKANLRKSICFVTGVPGSGKTLVGLEVATSSALDERAVFLSGNGPLVDVLREALARDEQRRAVGLTKGVALRKVRSFVQNIHHFRDEALTGSGPPDERVVIFDEAQRAWDRAHTAKFMTTKRGQESFELSEPEFLIQIMDRHQGWCVIIALIGGGQEINSGEIGLGGWTEALQQRFPDWDVYFSDRLNETEYAGGSFDPRLLPNRSTSEPDLHLATSMRSFRAESLSLMVHHLIAGNAEEALTTYRSIARNFPIRITRDLSAARQWIRQKARGTDTYGVIASSGGIRLKPHGLFVKNQLDAAVWFLNPPDDVRSCHFLEDVATEFDIQGLELDWCLLAWDADFRYRNMAFEYWNFSGTRWHRRNQESAQRYLENAYRVLLTRARQGMVIYVPEGDPDDATRMPAFYDSTYDYLQKCGIPQLTESELRAAETSQLQDQQPDLHLPHQLPVGFPHD
jgi:hypothetical protein